MYYAEITPGLKEQMDGLLALSQKARGIENGKTQHGTGITSHCMRK